MEVRLVVERGNTKKRSYTLQSRETVIGRRQDCDLRIVSSEVSRRHCVLTIDNKQLTVKDLDSVNGTFVNGARITGKRALRSGDHLEVGPVRFIVRLETTRDALDRLEQTVDARSLQDDVEELPLAEVEDEDFALAAEVAELDELPLMEEDAEAASGDPDEVEFEVEPVQQEEDDDDPIPVVDELEEDPSWKLPQAGELRDILSHMDDKPRKKTEER